MFDAVQATYGSEFVAQHFNRQVPFYRATSAAGLGAVNRVLAQGNVQGHGPSSRVAPLHHVVLMESVGDEPDGITQNYATGGSLLFTAGEQVANPQEQALITDLTRQVKARDGTTVLIKYFTVSPGGMDNDFEATGFHFEVPRVAEVSEASILRNAGRIDLDDPSFLQTGVPRNVGATGDGISVPGYAGGLKEVILNYVGGRFIVTLHDTHERRQNVVRHDHNLTDIIIEQDPAMVDEQHTRQWLEHN
ncbi:MAG: hypothetical protein V1735_01195 [Nanoarchaeota archaeon]